MRYYVYAVLVDGVMRYIGKGHGKRAESHFKMVRSIARRRAAGESVTTTHLYNRLTKAWRNGAVIESVILVDNLTEPQAFERESQEIQNTKGLWNLAPGGYGFTSKTARVVQLSLWGNPDYRQKMLEKFSSPEYRANVSAGVKAAIEHDPEYRKKLGQAGCANKGKPSVKKSEAAKLRWLQSEFREKMEARYRRDSSLISERASRGWTTRRKGKIGG